MGTSTEPCVSNLEDQFLQRVLVSACSALERALKSEQLENKPPIAALVPTPKAQKGAEVNMHTPAVSYLPSARFLCEQNF